MNSSFGRRPHTGCPSPCAIGGEAWTPRLRRVAETQGHVNNAPGRPGQSVRLVVVDSIAFHMRANTEAHVRQAPPARRADGRAPQPCREPRTPYVVVLINQMATRTNETLGTSGLVPALGEASAHIRNLQVCRLAGCRYCPPRSRAATAFSSRWRAARSRCSSKELQQQRRREPAATAARRLVVTRVSESNLLRTQASCACSCAGSKFSFSCR